LSACVLFFRHFATNDLQMTDSKGRLSEKQ
jgi:hypothetical protein